MNYLESILELIKKALISGVDVLITGFGKFCVREKGSRRGRNPATGEELILDARRVVTLMKVFILTLIRNHDKISYANGRNINDCKLCHCTIVYYPSTSPAYAAIRIINVR